MTALTNTAIAALADGRELKDDRVPGLSVRAHKSGKSFMLYYRTKLGIPRRPKIGDVGVLELKDARDIARGMLAQVAAGGDPVADRVQARNDPTLDELWSRVEQEHYTDETTWGKEAQRLYHKYVSVATFNSRPLGKTRANALDVEHIEHVHKAMVDTPYQANRIIAILGKAFKLAEKWKIRPKGSNPCRYVERHPEQKRKRKAEPAEIAKLGRALDKRAAENPSGVAFLYVLLFSGARPSEIERATPGQLQRFERKHPDRDEIEVFGVLRDLDAKMGARDVYLPPQAMAVLDRLPAKRDTLTGRRSLPKKLWETIRTEIGAPGLWARDMRRTFASVGYSSGVDKKVMGSLLGHASPATTDIYALLMEDPAHRAAAATAGAMELLLKGGK